MRNTKKMKKSYGNYIDAIENFIIDCGDGCYYNTVFDEFSDVLSEDEVMDALGTLMDDNIICYNEKNEKFEVCDKSVKMKKSDFEHPLTVSVNGSPFSLNGETHEGFDELESYLCGEISRNEQSVRRYCNDNYDRLGYTWYDLMNEYLKTDYDVIVGQIADAYAGYIWNTCVFRKTFDDDSYFGITAEWVSGGYGMAKMRTETKGRKSDKSTKKMRKSNGYWDDYWEFDNPEHRRFIDEVRQNGTVVDVDYSDRTSVFRTYEYNGKRYVNAENPAYPEGIGDMYLMGPEPDYSVLTFDLFKKTIEDYINDYDRQTKDFYERESMPFPYEPLEDYTFHNDGNGHYTFSYDGPLYDLLVYDEDGGAFKDGLHRALENAGFEWGVNIEQDTYSDIGFYNHSEMKSARKSYVPQYIGFRDMVSKMRGTRDNSKIFKE